jgi:hypothetical protein
MNKNLSQKEINDLKQACKIILKVFEECDSGQTFVHINNTRIDCDTGYVEEFCITVLNEL